MEAPQLHVLGLTEKSCVRYRAGNGLGLGVPKGVGKWALVAACKAAFYPYHEVPVP